MVETRAYAPGKLKPGTFRFTAMAGDETRATLQITITRGGVLRDTPTQPGAVRRGA